MKRRFTKILAAFTLLVFMMPTMAGWGQTKDPVVLFHETFGTGASSAREWQDSYSVKSGVSAVYSSISYTMTNLKQSNNNAGSAGNNGGAGLMQSSTSTDAEFVSGPYNVSDYESLSVTYDWKAGSIKNTYYTKLYYKTSSTATSWTEVTGGTGNGATTYIKRSYNLPAVCQVETLYLKVAFYTSNTQAHIDEFEITGTPVSIPTGPSITLDNYEINATASQTTGTLNVTYQEIATELGTEIQWFESDGETIATYNHDWLNVSVNNNTLSYSIEANNGAARQPAYFKIYGIDNGGNDVYSDLVTVTQAAASYTLTLAENEDVLPLLFDGEENPIEIDDETGTATIEAGTEVRVSIDMIVNCKVFSGLSVTNVGEGGITEIDPNVYYSFLMPAQNSTLTVTTTETAPQTLTVAGLGHVSSGELYVGPESDIIDLMNLTNNEASICGQMNVMINELAIATNYELQSVTLNYGSTTEEVPMIEGLYIFTMPSSNATLTFNTNEVTTVVDELTRSFIGVTNQAYTEWEGKKSNSTAVYAGCTSGGGENYTYIQLKSKDSESGIVSTTSGGKVKKVKVTWNSSTTSGRTLDIYGKNTPYSAATDLYNNNTRGTKLGSIVYGTSTELIVEGNYTYIGLRSNSGAMYIDKIEITWDNNYSATSDITAHTENAGWYFISSPFSANNSLVATDEDNLPVAMDDDATDLYYYDEPTHMWMNYKQHPNDFTFANGVGYLYANSQKVTLTFAGTSLVANDTKDINLSYTETAAPLAGWNLVGNPFDCPATLNLECYTISGMAINTQAHLANNYTVAPCEGVMVKATPGNQTVTFTKATQGQASQINQLEMTVAQQVMSRGTATSMVHDNAIVNFNAGSQLEKFPFNADAAELYIPQDGKDYAIVSSEAQGEMPVNFKAKENGNYTLSINVEGMEMNYLHLIDNKTGNDVDLLQTPSYSFEAKTTDYESRFKLVFVANNEESVSAGSETFAFFSNGSFVINNPSTGSGPATLQVIDITGRIVKSESINGCANVNVNAAPGVYMLRLVNGDNVKVQKVVVK